jgi:hypothetical protein
VQQPLRGYSTSMQQPLRGYSTSMQQSLRGYSTSMQQPLPGYSTCMTGRRRFLSFWIEHPDGVGLSLLIE